MPRKAKRLTPKQVRDLPPPPRDAKHPKMYSVGGVAGLQLQVTPSGARSWVLQASVNGKVRSMGLGSYDELPLEDARAAARAVRARIREGADPIAERRAARAAKAAQLTFAEAARQTYDAKKAEWRDGPRKRDWISSLERYAYPVLGELDVAEIELPHVLKVLKPVWQTKTATAQAVRQRMQAVFDWAEASGYRDSDNPARWAKLKHVLPNPSKIHRTRHHRALPWDQMPAFMQELRQREGVSARALEFAILTAARSGEVRLATWDEIDFHAKLWTVPAERAKTGRPHRVPLSQDAIKLLKALPQREDSSYIFPAQGGQPLSDMSISAVCRRMEVDAVPHGMRSSFKDYARNRTSYADEVSELALAHVNSDATRAAYARDELLPKRAKLMESWARFLREQTGKAKAGTAKVTPIRAAEATTHA